MRLLAFLLLPIVLVPTASACSFSVDASFTLSVVDLESGERWTTELQADDWRTSSDCSVALPVAFDGARLAWAGADAFHVFDPLTGETRSFPPPSFVGSKEPSSAWARPIDGHLILTGDLLIAFDNPVASVYNPSTGRQEPVAYAFVNTTTGRWQTVTQPAGDPMRALEWTIADGPYTLNAEFNYLSLYDWTTRSWAFEDLWLQRIRAGEDSEPLAISERGVLLANERRSWLFEYATGSTYGFDTKDAVFHHHSGLVTQHLDGTTVITEEWDGRVSWYVPKTGENGTYTLDGDLVDVVNGYGVVAYMPLENATPAEAFEPRPRAATAHVVLPEPAIPGLPLTLSLALVAWVALRRRR
jgi:hypothetical protein